jgi:hypothetical protein
MPMIRGMAMSKPSWVSLKDGTSAATRLREGAACPLRVSNLQSILRRLSDSVDRNTLVRPELFNTKSHND